MLMQEQDMVDLWLIEPQVISKKAKLKPNCLQQEQDSPQLRHHLELLDWLVVEQLVLDEQAELTLDLIDMEIERNKTKFFLDLMIHNQLQNNSEDQTKELVIMDAKKNEEE